MEWNAVCRIFRQSCLAAYRAVCLSPHWVIPLKPPTMGPWSTLLELAPVQNLLVGTRRLWPLVWSMEVELRTMWWAVKKQSLFFMWRLKELDASSFAGWTKNKNGARNLQNCGYDLYILNIRWDITAMAIEIQLGTDKSLRRRWAVWSTESMRCRKRSMTSSLTLECHGDANANAEKINNFSW